MQVIPVKGDAEKNRRDSMLDKKRNQVVPESGRLGGKLVSSLAVRCVKEELCSACFVDQRTDQRPEDWEHPGNGFYRQNFYFISDLGARMMRTLPRVSG